MKIGIFGGSFNPPHLGHINSLQTVHKKLGLDKIFVVPAAKNPLKVPIELPTAEQRVQMLRLALQSFQGPYSIDDQEIRRGGVSYTIDTIKSYRKSYPGDELFLILGADNLENLAEWKDFRGILKECNLIVTTRPGHALPHSAEDLPEFLKDLILEFDFNFVELNTGRNIQFVSLTDIDVSASDVRKKLRTGKSVEKYLPLSVEKFIRDEGLYKGPASRLSDYRKLVQFCAHYLSDKKAIALQGFDLRELDAPTEFTLVASGTSTRHATSLAENLTQAVKEEFGMWPLSVEGVGEGRWVVVDYGSLIVHLFYDFVRQEYALEKLWASAPELKFDLKSATR